MIPDAASRATTLTRLATHSTSGWLVEISPGRWAACDGSLLIACNLDGPHEPIVRGWSDHHTAEWAARTFRGQLAARSDAVGTLHLRSEIALAFPDALDHHWLPGPPCSICGDDWCRECGGSGRTDCTCRECGDDHERHCPDCDGPCANRCEDGHARYPSDERVLVGGLSVSPRRLACASDLLPGMVLVRVGVCVGVALRMEALDVTALLCPYDASLGIVGAHRLTIEPSPA